MFKGLRLASLSKCIKHADLQLKLPELPPQIRMVCVKNLNLCEPQEDVLSKPACKFNFEKTLLLRFEVQRYHSAGLAIRPQPRFTHCFRWNKREKKNTLLSESLLETSSEHLANNCGPRNVSVSTLNCGLASSVGRVVLQGFRNWARPPW